MKYEDIKNKIKRELELFNNTILHNKNQWLENEKIEEIANEQIKKLNEVLKISKIDNLYCEMKLEEESEIAKHYILKINVFNKNYTNILINLSIILFNWELSTL